MLNTKDLAILKARLRVPLAVHDIMAGIETLDDDACYALHAEISDMPPQDALVAIAISARSITAYCTPGDEIARFLKSQAGHITDTYAALCTHAAPELQDLLDNLGGMTESLRALERTLKTLDTTLQTRNETASALCRILGIQAGAQKIIVEELAELHENDFMTGPRKIKSAEVPATLLQ